MTIVKLGIAALVTSVALAGAASAFDLKTGSPTKLVPTSIQLGIISPPNNICPGNGKLTAWVETNKPGTINILLVKRTAPSAAPTPSPR